MIEYLVLVSTPGLLVTIIVIITTIYLLKSYVNAPLGPWGLPIIGYYPFLGQDIHLKLAELAKKYGSVFIFNFAGQEYIHLNSLKAVKEAYVTKADCFASRCHKYGPVHLVFGNGIAFAEGENWRVLRKFLGQGLRHLGIGGNTESFSGPALDCVKATLEELRKNDAKEVDLMSLLNDQCRVAVRRVFLGDLVTEEDAKRITEVYEGISRCLTVKNLLLVGHMPKYFMLPFMSEIQSMKSYKKKMNSLLQKIIDDHKSTIDADNPRDFIDLYLNERQARQNKKDPQALFFTDDVLIDTLIQVFGDGSFGVAFCIAAFLKKLSFLPEVQNRIHQEVIDVFGSERFPAWGDRKSLPYTFAAIKELLRTAAFNPLSSSLECTKDTTLMGVPVSKGQVTAINLHSIHKDPEAYTDPEKFDPNRFLANTSLQTVVFGIGKRGCAGESMVMLQMFAYIASICQSFVLSSETTTQIQDVGTVDEMSQCRVEVHLRKSAVTAEE